MKHEIAARIVRSGGELEDAKAAEYGEDRLKAAKSCEERPRDPYPTPP
jgi:hypothetical protein